MTSTVGVRVGFETSTKSGIKQYVGKAFDAGYREARMLLTRADLVREAKAAAWDALLKRSWLGIAAPGSPDPDFHLAMRYHNQLGLVFVAVNWNSTSLTEFDRERKARLLAHADELRGVAIVARCNLFAPIRVRPSAGESGASGTAILFKDDDLQIDDPSIESVVFEDAGTAAPLDETRFDTRARMEISDWELLDLAIQHARNELEKTGYRIESWTSERGSGAHIVAQKDGMITRVVFAGARFPAVEATFDRSRLRAVAQETLVGRGQLAKVSVVFAHVDEPFGGDHVMPLYRGEPVVAKCGGIEIIDPARMMGR